MIQRYINGLSIYAQSIPLSFDGRFIRYLFYTGIVSLLLGLLFLGGVFYTGWDAYHEIITKWAATEGIWGKIVLAGKEVFPFFLLILLAFVLFKNIILIVSGPILAKLSSAVDYSLTGKAEDLSGSVAHQIQRTIRFSIWSSIREILFTLLCLPLNFIPVVGSILATVLMFLIQSYYAGANYMDFTLERRGLNAQEGIAVIRNNRALVTGIGAGFMLLLLVPLAGLILAPAAAVIAATTGYIQKIKGVVF